MEYKLAKNDHKGGWRKKGSAYCIRRARQELVELEEALARDDVEDAMEECADVANFVMMLFDNVDSLGVRGLSIEGGEEVEHVE